MSKNLKMTPAEILIKILIKRKKTSVTFFIMRNTMAQSPELR